MGVATQASTNAKCNVDQSILLVIDIQTNLGQAMPGKVLNRVVSNTQLLSRTAGLLGVPLIVTEQYPRGLGDTVDEVAAAFPDSAKYVEKTCFSAASADGVSATIKDLNRSQIILVGMEAHVCVLQSALDFAAAGLQVFVVEDAICSRRLENYQNALDRMRQSQLSSVSAESVIFEWLVDSRHEHFKEISALLR